MPGFKYYVIYHLFFPVCLASLKVDTVLILFDVINIVHDTVLTT